MWLSFGCHFLIYLMVSLCVCVKCQVLCFMCDFCVSWKFVVSSLWFLCLLKIYQTYCVQDLDFVFFKSLTFDSLIFLCILSILKVYCVAQYMFQESNVWFNMCSKNLMCVVQFFGLCVYLCGFMMFPISNLLVLLIDVT